MSRSPRYSLPSHETDKAIQALFISFMDHTPTFTWIMDEEENLLFANKSLLEYFHLDPAAFGKKLNSIIPGPISGIFHEKHNLVLKYGRQDQSIVKSLMADGEEHVYQVIVFPVQGDARGMMVGGEASDITGSYNARQEEKKAGERLLHISKTTSEAIIRAQEEEKTRIGHELHDNVNQHLASGQLFLSLLDQGTDSFQEIKDKTMNALQLGIEEIRKLSKAMVIPDLKGGGLVASIEELVEELRFLNIFNVWFDHNKLCDIEAISQSKKITLFRIVQEQTRNIVKYSNAKEVEISLHCCDDQVRLMIIDDGNGFDPQNTRRGLGLSQIYERTRLYGGKVVLVTMPGKGCSIIVNIPFESHDNALQKGCKD